MAADICVSCYHIVEQIKDTDPHLARRVSGFKRWNLINDIANTRKHYLRKKASRQIALTARLCVEVDSQDRVAFLETEPIATTANGSIYHIGELIVSFIDHFHSVTGGNDGSSMQPFQRKPKEFVDRLKLRITPETSTASGTSFSFVTRNADGELEPKANFEFEIPEMVLDVPKEIRTGRYQLTFELDEMKKIVEANNAANEVPWPW